MSSKQQKDRQKKVSEKDKKRRETIVDPIERAYSISPPSGQHGPEPDAGASGIIQCARWYHKLGVRPVSGRSFLSFHR